jgi:hypothetical protein
MLDRALQVRFECLRRAVGITGQQPVENRPVLLGHGGDLLGILRVPVSRVGGNDRQLAAPHGALQLRVVASFDQLDVQLTFNPFEQLRSARAASASRNVRA